MKKNRADEELAMKTEMKKILSEEQYKSWTGDEKRGTQRDERKIERKKGKKPVEQK